MNLVAHQTLSFNIDKIQVGNFLGDFIKGNKYKNFEHEISLGIKLHRNIDSFTDSNNLISDSAKIFSKYGKYSHIIIDVVFDYFLIKNWSKFRKDSFQSFCENVYFKLEKYRFLYSDFINLYLDYMIKENWYLRYSNLTGIEYTLESISKRSKFKNNIKDSIKEIYIYEDFLEDKFLKFYPILENFSYNYINSHLLIL